MTEVVISDLFRSIGLVTVAIFLAWLTFKVFLRFTAEMEGSENNPRPGVWLEANWGGLGGGISGWRVSNAVIYLLLMSLLLGCLSLAVFSLRPTTGKKDDVKKDELQGELKKDGGKKDGPEKSDGKNGAGKNDAAGEAKAGEAKQSGPKQVETKQADSATGDRSGEKSSTAPADTRKRAVTQTGK